MLYATLRSLLFTMDAEKSHDLSLKAIQKFAQGSFAKRLQAKIPSTPTEVMGIQFDNPVGLAAGLDKNADYIDGLGSLGFGFLEVGTITPRPQPGNPKPRLFRIPSQQAIINRFGFNNKGIDHLLQQVQARQYKGPVGINIGKNFDTPVEEANDDYLHCLREAYPHADYITVNISSPNTPGLRDLQHGKMLDELFGALKQEQRALESDYLRYIPIAVKIAPDLDDNDIKEFAAAALEHNIDAVIATNTTFSRDSVEGLKHAEEVGGLSGAPLTERSTLVISKLNRELKGHIPIIGVGGIMCGKDAVDKINAGASLIQLYSGFVYKGPDLIVETAQALHQHMSLDDL